MKKDLGVLRIIPCLDIKNGRVVKGINFLDLKDAGDPFESSKIYSEEGADEICVLDISASVEGRKASLEMIKKIAQNVFVPITFGGGVRTVHDMGEYLRYGADKVSINTGAVENPEVIEDCAKSFGSQCVVVAIDAKRVDGKFKVFIYSGSKNTNIDAIEWAKKVEELGAGEILLTSIDKDGTQDGYDIELLEKIVEAVSIPVIISGGAGKQEHFLKAAKTGASACLAASVFHYGKIKIRKLKEYLKENKIHIRT